MELVEYCKKDVELLRLACQAYTGQVFAFQRALIDCFGAQHPPQKLHLIDPYRPPFFTLASFSFALLKVYGLSSLVYFKMKSE